MIRLAEQKDYLQLANMKWIHCEEDEEVYGEKNIEGVDKEGFVAEFIEFMQTNKDYIVFVVEENEQIISAMFVNLITKVPKPNRKTNSLAYLTNVHTMREYRNKGIGTKLLKYIKTYLEEQGCEMIIVWPSDNSVRWYKRNGFCSENEVLVCDLNI